MRTFNDQWTTSLWHPESFDASYRPCGYGDYEPCAYMKDHVRKWCAENLQGEWDHVNEYDPVVGFMDERDAVLFMLRWF